MESYLLNRTLVKCEGASSKSFPVLASVTQGSHLDPTIFLAFINNINDIDLTASTCHPFNGERCGCVGLLRIILGWFQSLNFLSR
ncbi:hypothetical protein J6590_065354 [Homalodisca vitripennis]|nr:hypothetical protein J6590_065354 [Homalodisca vitripennis]